MKSALIRTSIAVVALLIAPIAAQSADLPRPSYKAPYAPVYVAPFSWSGFYVGLNGGYGFGTSNWANALATTGDFRVSGALAGVTLGYNLQTGSWVWGLEADIDASWIKGSTTSVICSGCETSNPWLGTGRARIGYAWDRWLPYLTGGAAYGGIKMSGGGNSETTSKFGWTAGAGVEYAFLGNWSTKLEYLYVDLGKVSCGTTVCTGAGGGVDVSFTTSLVRAGLNYRF
jgi:outer membrane immunogenic protein